MKVLCIIAALAANGVSHGICLAQARQIQVEQSPEIPLFVERLDDLTMLRNMVTFADCVVMREPKALTNFLRGGNFEKPHNDEVRSIIQRNQTCLRDGKMHFNQVLFAGAAAESLYRVSGLFFAKVAIPAAKSRNSFGMCVAVAKAKEVDAVLAAFPASSEEKAALAALAETIDGCRPEISRHASVRRAAVMADMFPIVYDLFLGPQ